MPEYVLQKTTLLSIIFFLLVNDPANATWCVAGNSNRGTITPSSSQTTTATFNPNGLVPYWSFAGTAGVTYYFSICSGTNTEDAILNVYSGASPGGALVAANDEGVCASKSSLTFVCPANGTYYVAANRYPWFSFSTTGTIGLTNYICGGVAGLAVPFSENWTTSNVTTACSSWMAHGAGGEGDWYIYSSGNNAGGTGNEVGIEGNQADLYGVNAVLTATLTSPKLNTTGATSFTYSWKQSLGTWNTGNGGPDNVTIKLQSSNDLVTWTDRYSASYAVTTTSSVNWHIWQATQSVTFNPGGNDLWVRYSINGTMFTVRGWWIDNGSATVMPVELTSFTGKNDGHKILLNWETASETNNDFFAIERSTDGSNWSTIGKVKGFGTSSFAHHYDFIDEQISNLSSQYSNLYYRLKQTDFDGRYEYFGPIAVDVVPSDDWSLIIGNPAQNELNGTMNIHEEADVLLHIIDLQGRVVVRENLSAVKGSNLLKIGIQHLDKGIYFIKAFNSDRSIVRKFIIE